MSFFAPGRDLKALGNLLWVLFQKVSVSLFKTFGGQSFPSLVSLSLADSFLFFHWMTAELFFKFGSLCEQLLMTAIQKGLQSSNSLQLLYGCRHHGSCNDASRLVLDFAHFVHIGFGCIVPCCNAVL